MKVHLRRLWFASLLLGGCERDPVPEGHPSTCLAPTSGDPRVHPRSALFRAALEEVVSTGLPGAVMAIRDRDGWWQGAAGMVDLGRQTPMQTCHRTRIASVTKPFVAAAVMLLMEDGVLELDAPITTYLPEEDDRLPNASRISTRQLLSHQSGVHNFLDVPFVLELFNRPERTWRLEACYAHALRSSPDFEPGEDWSYSNTNYLLLARIIEAVTGQPHEDVLRTRIFEPLGMVSTSYRPDSFAFDGVAHGYFDLFGDRHLIDASESYANSCVGPDGGMVSTAEDLLTFLDATFSRGTLLRPSSIDAMLPYVETGEELFPHYGLGLESWVDGEAYGYGHGGHEFGYRTFAYYFPQQDVSFVVWVNASSLLPGDDNISAVVDAARNRLRDVVLDGS